MAPGSGAPEHAGQDSSAAVHDIFIGRQPILNREEQLVAYELLFRSGHHNHARIEDDLSATAAVISHTFSDLGVEKRWAPTRASST